ncbi:MAG TPA: ATP-binding protein [Actinoallomurus sp.]|nr:ATP-binding protein [Actinoallomurus sp.]
MVSEAVTGEFKLRLDPNTESPRRARVAMGDPLYEWGLGKLLDDATLVVSELVSNAAKLGQTFELTLTPNGRTLRIEVRDHSGDKPVMKTGMGNDRAEDGRGLLVVDALADLWGFDARPDGGKVVWAVLTCP